MTRSQTVAFCFFFNRGLHLVQRHLSSCRPLSCALGGHKCQLQDPPFPVPPYSIRINAMQPALADDGAAATATSTTAAGPDQDADVGGAGPGPTKFLYFAYGSNLLARRIQLMNPTARRFGIGLLKDYRLDFSTPPSKRWGGAPATVVPDEGEGVWGAIWSLDLAERDNLDEQEGVPTGWYDVINATVTTSSGRPLACRSYLMHVAPPKLAAGETLPAERQPSLVYKRVVIAGARESGLPADYIARLEAIPDNGSPGVDPPVPLDSLPV